MSAVVTVRTYPAPAWRRREIWRYAGCKQPDPTLESLRDECIQEVESVLKYTVCYQENPVIRTKNGLDIGFTITNSSLLKQVFTGCERYILLAATVGLELDRLIARYGRLSPAKAVLLQAIGAERIEALCDAAVADLETTRRLCPRVSPGYGDLPLGLQTDILRVLDCPRHIGLTLLDSMLMSPSKSVTALIGVKA